MIIKYKDLENIRKKHQEIIFCSGCFDLLHVGHLFYLEEAKKQGKILVVGLLSDKFIKEKKGRQRPIINEFDRLLLVDSLKIVDYTILINESFDIRNYNYEITDKERFFFEAYMPILERLKPNYLAHSEYLKISNNEKEKLQDINIKLVSIKIVGDVSTTKIIERITNS